MNWKGAPILSTFIDAFTNARWKLLALIDINQIQSESSDSASPSRRLVDEALDGIQETPQLTIDLKTALSLWVIQQLATSSVGALPSLLRAFRCSVVPFLFDKERSATYRRLGLDLLSQGVHQLIVELGTAAIGGRVPILHQLAETVFGSPQIISADLELDQSPLFARCVTPVLLWGQRTVGLSRVFIRTLIDNHDRELSM